MKTDSTLFARLAVAATTEMATTIQQVHDAFTSNKLGKSSNCLIEKEPKNPF